MNVFDLFAKISLDTQGFSSGLNTVVSGAKKMGAAVGVAVTAATTATVAFGKQSVAVGQEFDRSMSQVAATMGVSVDEIQELREFALKMGQTTVFSATQSAQALNYMALAGYDAEKSMAMLPNVLNLAASGGMDLALASDMITDAQSALGLSMDDTTELVNKMAKAASSSNTSVSQLGEAILQIGGTAKKLKGGTTELTTILGILADNGMKGAEGGTHLRNMLNSLISPSKEAEEMMADLGISLYDAEGNMRSLDDVFVDLRESMNALTTQAERDQVVSTLFNARDMKAAEALLAGVGDRYAELSGKINNAAGAAKEMSGTQLQNLSGDITLFKSALEGAQIVVSDKLTPTIREFVQFGTNGLQKLTEAFSTGGLTGLMEQFGVILSEGLNKVIEFLPKAVDAGARLLDAVVNGFINNLDTVTDSMLKVFNVIVDRILKYVPKLISAVLIVIEKVARYLGKNANIIVDSILNIIQEILDLLNDDEFINTIIDAAADIIVALANGLAKSVPKLLKTVADILVKLVNKLSDPTMLVNIVKAGANLISQVVKGLIQAIPDLVRAIPTIIDNLVTALVGSADVLVTATVDLVDAILEKLPKIITEILTAWPKIVSSLTSTMTKPEHILTLVQGVINLVNAIITHLPEIISVIITAIPDIITGIVSAMTNMDNVRAIVKGLGDMIDKVIEDAYSNNIFYQFGRKMAKQFGIGFEDESNFVEDYSSSGGGSFSGGGRHFGDSGSGAESVNTITRAVPSRQEVTGSEPVTIELSIDGQKFGKIMYDLNERERQRRGATVLDRITANG